jgi:hypothetical protein
MAPLVAGVIVAAVGAVSSIISGAQNVKAAKASAQAEAYKVSEAMADSYIQTKVGQRNVVLYTVIGVVSFSVLLMVFKMRK